MRRPAFRRARPSILELIEAWDVGPAPPLPDGAPDAALLEAVEAGLADAELARATVHAAADRASLELGIAVLGETGDERDAEVLETLARHAALGPAAGEALAVILGDPAQAWRRVASVSAGRLENALDGPVDDALLDGACRILSGLVLAGEMESYQPAPRVAHVVLELLAGRPLTLVRAAAVEDLRGWAEDFEEHVVIAERCARLLGRA